MTSTPTKESTSLVEVQQPAPTVLHETLASEFNAFVQAHPGQVFSQEKYDSPENYFLHILTIRAANIPTITPERVASLLEERRGLYLNEHFTGTVSRVVNSLNVVLLDRGLSPVRMGVADLHLISREQMQRFGLDPDVSQAFKLDASDDVCVLDELVTDPARADVLMTALVHEGSHVSRDSMSSLFDIQKDSIAIEEGIVHLLAKGVLAYMELDAELIAGETYEVETWMVDKISKVLSIDSASISHPELRRLLEERYPEISNPYDELVGEIVKMNVVMDAAEVESQSVLASNGDISEADSQRIMAPVRLLQTAIKDRWGFI